MMSCSLKSLDCKAQIRITIDVQGCPLQDVGHWDTPFFMLLRHLNKPLNTSMFDDFCYHKIESPGV